MIPFVSVIMPVYKSEQFVGKSINSILGQQFREFELIVVDDGSPDKSGQICDEFAKKDDRIRVFHKENGGVSSARNLGLDNAIGEWITFVDSDDTIAPSYFELKDLGCVDFAIQRWRFNTETETREPLEEGIYKEHAFITFMKDSLHKDILRMVAAKFLRRSIVEKYNIRFEESIKLGEDTIFMLKYYSHINSVSVNNSSYYCYFRPENWGGIKYSVTRTEFKFFFQKFNSAYSALPYESQMLITFMTNFYLSMLSPPKGFLTNIYINTIPEYLALKKNNLQKGNTVHRTKYLLYKFISLFR